MCVGNSFQERPVPSTVYKKLLILAAMREYKRAMGRMRRGITGKPVENAPPRYCRGYPGFGALELTFLQGSSQAYNPYLAARSRNRRIP